MELIMRYLNCEADRLRMIIDKYYIDGEWHYEKMDEVSKSLYTRMSAFEEIAKYLREVI
jgi:hypothetical protein